jgi:hypothetical protein
MASTYSQNLRLELISSGAQANTWGNTTNTNIGTLLEEAITGTVQIDISSGNKVLTALNGAYDQARAMVIIVTGSSASTRIVTAPANVSKVYVVDNTSDVDVTIKTAASGFSVGVVIPTGTSKFVYTDGTDFFEGTNAADYFTANTVEASTVKISGTVTNSTDATTKAYVDSSITGAGFPINTTMIFAQAVPPTYWSPQSGFNNYAMRIVDGGTTGGSTGGSVPFTTAFKSQAVTGSVDTSGFSVGNTTLSVAQMPSHGHAQDNLTVLWTNAGYAGSGMNAGSTGGNTGGAGSSQPHNHSISGSATFSGTAINLAVQYLDMIVARRTS